ncbi:MAG: family 78 glycoside hydrolase catalytic domain [Bacteroidales bacterium]|nr:family 78 glycoside hydrolase catalytic domain [Bacteroidales bacterium]
MRKNLFIIIAVSAVAASCHSSGTAPSGILTEALDDSAWEASEWISAVNAPVVDAVVNDYVNFRSADGSSWFLATVRNEKPVRSARWMSTGLGVFDLYLNGVTVGKEVLRPGFTHPYRTKLSFTYDVTDRFERKAGAENVLSAQMGPAWWADKVVSRRGQNGMRGRKCAFRSVLELTYEDGSTMLFGTDTLNWRAGIAGPVTHSGIFDGEEYDARIPMGWETPEMLLTPEINTEFKGEIIPTCGAEVYHRDDIALSPVEAYTWKDVEGASDEEFGKVKVVREFGRGETMTLEPGETLVIDFGQNAAAVPDFEFKAGEGTVLTCLPGEILNDGNGSLKRGMDGPGGSVHRTNLRIHEEGARVIYTFGPARGYVSYRPGFTFFGYRYISVTATGRVSIRKVRSVPVTSVSADMETGSIRTGNDLVNRLVSNARWGMMSNYLSVPTDCPQRNERLGWTADTQVFTETGTFFANTDRFFHKWMRDMRDSQSEKGGFPGVAPIGQYGGDLMMRFGWADAGVIVPWTVWKQFGDNSIVDENWESMEKFMALVNETKYDHVALLSENRDYQWADHLSYEALETHDQRNFRRDRTGHRTPGPDMLEYWNYMGASYWAIDAAMMRDMALSTGRDASVYETMLSDAKNYLRSRFMNADGTFKVPDMNTMQTSALFALKNSLLEGEAREKMIGRLRENFASHGNCLQTGFLGTSILMPTLTENGMVDLAYEVLLQRKHPSWLYSVDNGATTIWERWNSYTKENGMGPKIMNSFNHYAYGCVVQWLWETAAGIAADPANPGFRHIIMAPVPDRRLGSVDAEYHSAAGLIKSSWRYEGDTWVWNFTVPEGASATVTLPGETSSEIYSGGTYEVSRQVNPE